MTTFFATSPLVGILFEVLRITCDLAMATIALLCYNTESNLIVADIGIIGK